MLKRQLWIGLGLLLVLLAGCQAPAPPSEPIAWAWSYQAGDYIRGKPAIAGDVVYVGADDNRMHAVDAQTGKAIWEFETADNVTSAAAAGDDRVYFGSWDGAVYALDSAGELRWQYQTGGWVSASPVLHEGALYVGSQDGTFYALRAGSGELIWRYKTNGRIEASAAVAGNLAVFGSTDGYLHALDLDSGERQWFFYTDGAVVAPPVIAGGQVYAGSLERTLYALDSVSGQLRWSFTTEAAIASTPAVAGDRLFVGTDDGQVYALATTDGRPLWRQALDETIRSTLTVWNELLFLGTSSGNLYALDNGSGIPLLRYRLGGAIVQGPAISNNRLYVGSTARRLQAFDLAADQLAGLQPTATPEPDTVRPVKWQEAAAFYAQRAEDMPRVAEYHRLWAAKAAMPGIDAVCALNDVIAFRPQSPAAYHAHLILARHYAEQEAPAAEDAYRAALALDDNVSLRLELAHYLEAQGDLAAAYAEYRLILNSGNPAGADAFADMRRTGSDPLQVAEDLNSAFYYADVLETLRGVDEAAAVPLRAQAYMGLGRYEEAAAAYREALRADAEDERAVMGLARALAWLGDGQGALDLYSTVDTPDSRIAQAQLLAAEEPERALELYLESANPSAWWPATALLESQGRLTETLPIYARLAETDIQYADDAAYRLYVLGQRLGDAEAEEKGQALLADFGLNWLALRSSGDAPALATMPTLAEDESLLAKAQALETIGRGDLARMELVFAARFRRAPETALAMAQALAARGRVIEAQRIAEQYISAHKSAPVAFWKLSYPRPYSDTVTSAAAEFGVDPLLIWAVMREESRFDPDALSHAGARGLMQVIPATQMWIGDELGEEMAPGDAYVPEASIRMGAWLLGFLTDYFEGDWELAIPAYNAGAGAVEYWQADPMVTGRDDLLRWIGYNETRLYLKRVGLSYQVYRALYPPE